MNEQEPPKAEARPAGAAPSKTEHDVEPGVRPEPPPDIEHVYVADDPRTWSARKKAWTLVYISYCSLAGATLANIYFPAIAQIRTELGAGDQIIALSGSLFILEQGIVPLLWSMSSEIYGRKVVYFVSLVICFAGTLANGLVDSAGGFLACRVVSALGSSAVLTVGAGTLADMYEPHERGTRVGVFYSFPLVGPSIGSLLGGALTSGGGWRAPFYLMAAYLFTTVVATFFYKDTFRPERSAAWQTARKRYEQHRAADKEAADKLAAPATDPEAVRRVASTASVSRKSTKPFRPHFSDINPFSATRLILSRWNNVLVMLTSGLIFGAQFQLSYLAAIVFAAPPYNYQPIIIGLILLAFGGGNVVGSILGGRYSDRVLQRMTKRNNGVREAEMRIKSTYIAMPYVPLAYVAYAWTVEEHTNIAGPIVSLFIGGVTILWIYSSSLAYIVDANPGRASTAIAWNSAMRGTAAFVAIEIGQPLLNAMGNGWLFTGWAIVLAICHLVLVFVSLRGHSLRHKAIHREETRESGSK